MYVLIVPLSVVVTGVVGLRMELFAFRAKWSVYSRSSSLFRKTSGCLPKILRCTQKLLHSTEIFQRSAGRASCNRKLLRFPGNDRERCSPWHKGTL